MATSFFKTTRLFLLLMVSYTIMFELRFFMVSWNRRGVLKNYREKELMCETSGNNNKDYCPIPSFCSIPREEAGWVSEMLDSQESVSHDSGMDWIFKPHNSTAPAGVCDADYKMHYAYLMRLHLCQRPTCRVDADVCHTHAATDISYVEQDDPHKDDYHYQNLSVLFLLAGLALFLSVLFSCIAGLALWWWCSRRREERTNEEYGGGSMPRPQFEEPAMPRRYRYAELAAATGNFAENRRIGQGGFGSVYRGLLNIGGVGRHVAVKVLRPESSAQGRKEFEAEVKTTTRLSHRNIVQLLGWCEGHDDGLLLVYELVPGGNLDKRLHSPAPDRLLTWEERFKIALGLGCALRYLHTEVEQYCVVHGDIKSSNVMIDSSGEAKLFDFGLARLLHHGADPRTTEVVAGTIGYIDPEFVNSRRPCAESDVYSFGVLLLEIASGRRPTPPAGQPGRVRDMHGRNAVLDTADVRLGGDFDEQEMERVLVTGLWCAHPDGSQRPSMVQVMSFLRPEDAELRVPPTHRVLELETSQSHGWTRSSVASTTYHTPPDSGYLTTEH